MLRTACRCLLVLAAIVSVSCAGQSAPTDPARRIAPTPPSADGLDSLCGIGYPMGNGYHC